VLFDHFLLTRFSYRADDASKNVAGPTRKISEDPLDPDRLELRFKLFESACLPSVKAQTSQAFKWIIIVDKDLQPSFRTRLESLLAGRQNYYLHTYDPHVRMDRLEWLAPYSEAPPQYVLTTNLDDDDALPDNFVSAVQQHVRSLYDDKELPPVKILGIKQIVQWDMITSPDAPLGWRSPWHRGQRTSSCGYTILVKYPELSFCVLGTKHKHAEQYFVFSETPKNEYVRERRAAFVAAAAERGLSLENRPADTMFHDLTPETGPVLMSNHAKNVQKWRLYEKKRGRCAVTGPETFPNVSIDLDAFRSYSDDFRADLAYRIRSVIGGYLRMRRRDK